MYFQPASQKDLPVNQLLIPIAISLAVFSAAPRAATVDLSSFSTMVGTNSTATASPIDIRLLGTASATGTVSGLVSFQWNFFASDFYVSGFLNDYSYFSTTPGSRFDLADVGTTGESQSTGWQTYTFGPATSPYSGPITFHVANDLDDNDPSQLFVRELTTVAVLPPLPAVPEPETYAMLLAGLAFMGTIARRRARSTATP